ncbi:MAG: hypothetical protein IPI66_01675 [Chitinophagaceae bacterium]|nr:hypothetical protein [Chitinophagaceae bacterium]
MKQIIKWMNSSDSLKSLWVSFGLLILLIFPATLLAQKDSAMSDSAKATEVVAEETPALLSPALDFITVQKGDNTIDLKAALRTKFKGSSIVLPYLKVKFLLVTDTAEKEIGFAITNLNGKAVLNCKAEGLQTDKEGKLHFKAVFSGNKSLEATEGEMTIKRARLEITPVKEDSLLTVKVKLIDLGTGTETPVDKATLGVFVKRMFNPLKIGEGTTDETGEAVVEIPQKLPGDAKGNINLLVRLDENELYGNLEASVAQPWGVPVSDKIVEQPRALWSAHPPIWMLVTFIILMVAVWGHYIVIVFELFRLRKEEPHPVESVTNP